MLNRLTNIQLRSFAGIRRVLGIDVTKRAIRVVEMEEGMLSFFYAQPKLKVLHAFCIEISNETSWQEKSRLLKQQLDERNIKTHYAVTSIRSIGIKTLETVIPDGIEHRDEWIAENREKLLRIPLDSSKIDYVLEELDTAEHGTKVELTFVRREEIDRWKTFIHDAGLTLLMLGAGERDASNVMSLVFKKETINQRFFFTDHDRALATDFVNGKRVHTELLSNSYHAEHDEDTSLYISGETAAQISIPDSHIIESLSLQPEYCLAVGLCLKALIPNISPTNFMTGEEVTTVETQLYKMGFQGSVLCLGVVVGILLFIPFLLGWYFNVQSDRIDEQLLQNGASYSEVKLFETQVVELERQVNGKNVSNPSGEVAKLWNDIAATSPNGVWLYKITMARTDKKNTVVTLFGYTMNSDGVTEYLKNLLHKGYDAVLIRSGIPQQTEILIPAQKKFLSFELALTLKQ